MLLNRLMRPHCITIQELEVHHLPITYRLANVLRNDAIDTDTKAYMLLRDTLCDASGKRLFADTATPDEVLDLPVDFVSELLEKVMDGTSVAKESADFVK